MAKAFVTPQPVTITVDDVRRDRPGTKGSAPAEGKMPSMPQGHEHADPGSQLPLTPFLVLLRCRGAVDAKLEQRAPVNYHSVTLSGLRASVR